MPPRWILITGAVVLGAGVLIDLLIRWRLG
jgi:hypothetical protein